MERIQITLPEGQAQRLRSLVRRKQTSVAALIREAVDRTYPPRRRSDERWAIALGAVRGFHSGRAHISVEHDRDLADAFDE